MKIVLLNHFGADSGAPTGRIVGELAEELERAGHVAQVVSLRAGYVRQRRRGGRIFLEMAAHAGLFLRAGAAPRPDVIISLSSPIGLVITAGILARWHRCRHIHWAMDLHPDLSVALGECGANAPVATLLRGLMRRAYARVDKLVTLDEDMQAYLLSAYGVRSSVIGPFPPLVDWPEDVDREAGRRRWLYSGNFGRAHEIQVLLEVENALEQRGVEAELVLQGHGPQFEATRVRAAELGLRGVTWKPPCPLEELPRSILESKVITVTRRVEAKGLLLPSKLLLADLSGRSVLWIGDVDGAGARQLKKDARFGVFHPADTSGIASWLTGQFSADTASTDLPPRSTREAREEMFRRWKNLLAEG